MDEELVSPAADLDPVVHQPARLKVLMVLAATELAEFNQMAKLAGLTAGNLANHLKVLEEAGYVESMRRLVDLKPRMRYRLTGEGRTALKAYCAVIAEATRRIESLLD